VLERIVIILLINLIVFIKLKFPGRMNTKEAMACSTSFSLILLADEASEVFDWGLESIVFRVAGIMWLVGCLVYWFCLRVRNCG
jgi:hypothetical protein